MDNMLGTALHEVCGPLGDLLQRLRGKHGEEWLTALKLFLRKENPWPTPCSTIAIDFKVWKEIVFADKVVRLVVVTPADLGYPFGAPRKAIYERAQEQGLKLAHWDITDALFKAYNNQPIGETLVVASLPQDEGHERRHYQWKWLLRSVANQVGESIIELEQGAIGARWKGSAKFVFVLPNRA